MTRFLILAFMLGSGWCVSGGEYAAATIYALACVYFCADMICDAIKEGKNPLFYRDK